MTLVLVFRLGSVQLGWAGCYQCSSLQLQLRTSRSCHSCIDLYTLQLASTFTFPARTAVLTNVTFNATILSSHLAKFWNKQWLGLGFSVDNVILLNISNLNYNN